MVTFVLYYQLEFFFFLCYNNLLFFTKIAQIIKVNQVNSNLIPSKNLNLVYLGLFFIFLFFLKGLNFFLFSFTVILTIYVFICSKFLNNLNTSNSHYKAYNFLFVVFVSFFFFLFFVKSFLTLFFFVELYSVMYYFFFLNNFKLNSTTLLRYKNGILLLLWNNFLTTLFLALGTYFIAKTYGTTNFVELINLTNSTLYVYIYLFGLFWKLGIPLFHFFKVELYKYLLNDSVFMFSILTTLTNVLILYLCLSQAIIYNTIYLVNILSICVILSLITILLNLKVSNILHFFALSSVLTLATALSLFLL